MNHVFSNIIDQYILVYLENILVYSKTTKTHEKHLHEEFSGLHTYNLQAKYIRCEFGCA